MCRSRLRSSLEPPLTGREAFVKWMVKNRGEDPKFLGERWDRFNAMVANKDVWDKRNKRAFSDDAARGVRPEAESRPRLRARLPRHRLRRHHLRPARRRPHDHIDRRQARRQGARDRHRLGLPVGLSVAPHRQGLDDRDHQAARRAHARHLRRADRHAATPSSRRSRPRTPTAITAGRRPARSTRSSSPAASTTFRRRCCSS